LLSNKIFLAVLKHVRKSLKTLRAKDFIKAIPFSDDVKTKAELLKCLCSKAFGVVFAGMLVQ
jgi:hypothetical protein